MNQKSSVPQAAICLTGPDVGQSALLGCSMSERNQGKCHVQCRNDVRSAHVFMCLEKGHYAVSTDPSGANIPAGSCMSGWRHVQEFILGIQKALPFPASPEPVIRAIRDTGYYVYGSDLPHGTSQ